MDTLSWSQSSNCQRDPQVIFVVTNKQQKSFQDFVSVDEKKNFISDVKKDTNLIWSEKFKSSIIVPSSIMINLMIKYGNYKWFQLVRKFEEWRQLASALKNRIRIRLYVQQVQHLKCPIPNNAFKSKGSLQHAKVLLD